MVKYTTMQITITTEKKDFEKLFPWNISISAFHEEGTWKNDA